MLDAYLLGRRDNFRAPAREQPAQGAAAGLVGWCSRPRPPDAAAGYYNLQAYDLLTSVFAGEDPQWQACDRDRHQTGNGLITAVPGWVTVLLLGGDAGPGRQGRRTDTMMVASFEVATGKVSLFGAAPATWSRCRCPTGRRPTTSASAAASRGC